MSIALPAGVWYDAPNRRYRVRRYKNRIPYLVGYFPTLEAALEAHAALSTQLSGVRQLKRGERVAAKPTATSFLAVATAMLNGGRRAFT
jgi:hypothetical protein